jgi:hypothetical protein
VGQLAALVLELTLLILVVMVVLAEQVRMVMLC